MYLLFRHSGLRHPERAVLQVRVEREAAGASEGHGASRLAHVYNPRLLWPVQYPLSAAAVITHTLVEDITAPLTVSCSACIHCHPSASASPGEQCVALNRARVSHRTRACYSPQKQQKKFVFVFRALGKHAQRQLSSGCRGCKHCHVSNLSICYLQGKKQQHCAYLIR